MDSRTQKPSQPHYIINLATFLSQNEPTNSADEVNSFQFRIDKILAISEPRHHPEVVESGSISYLAANRPM